MSGRGSLESVELATLRFRSGPRYARGRAGSFGVDVNESSCWRKGLFMQLPTSSSSYRTRVRYGRYVARRLRRSKLTQLADDATTVTNALREAGRAWDDADDAIQDALADRDGADDDLDVLAQEARAMLAGRGADAAKRSPYTDVFPGGISYYTAAPLDEEVKRYTELKARLTEHLPAADEVRKKAVKGIEAGLKDYGAAVQAVDAARTAESLAATRLAKATDAWAKQMEKSYGALVSEVGRAAADRFFPRVARKASAEPKGEKGGAKPE